MGNETGEQPDEVSKRIDLHLLNPTTTTFEDIAKLFEKLKGRKLCPEEYDDARLFWEKLELQKTGSGRESGRGPG